MLLDAAGFTGAYALVLAAHLMALGLLITRVRIPYERQVKHIEPVWRSLSGSLGYAWHSPMLLGMLYVTIVMNALAFPVQQFIPAIGRDHLGVGASLVGLLAAGEGIGQLAGARIMAVTRNLQYHGRVFVMGSLVVLVMAILFVWSPGYGLAFLFLIMGGMGQTGFSTMQSAITMLSAPPKMRGQMMGLMSVCIGIGTPLGTLEIGAVVAAFSTQWAISVNAFAGLFLLLPAVVLTPLVWIAAAQAPAVPAQEQGCA